MIEKRQNCKIFAKVPLYGLNAYTEIELQEFERPLHIFFDNVLDKWKKKDVNDIVIDGVLTRNCIIFINAEKINDLEYILQNDDRVFVTTILAGG